MDLFQKSRRNPEDSQGRVAAPMTSPMVTHECVVYPHGCVDAFSLKMRVISHISIRALSSSNISTPKGRALSSLPTISTST